MQKLNNLAFVFPGQGSQSVGMLDGWQQHPIARSLIEQAKQVLGAEFIELIAQGPKDQLDLTVNTQPAMLLADVIAYQIWSEQTAIEPTFMAGHSLGEYAALVCAQAISFTDALVLVRARAEAMQQAVPVGVGGMAAILGLAASEVQSVCAQLSKPQTDLVVEAVNFNEPNQTVIAGSMLAVEQACERAKQLGARRALMLPVSGPFHSSLMKPAADNLLAKLQTIPINPAQIAVINNVDVAIVSSAAEIKDALYRQIFNPVRWTEIITTMRTNGVSIIVECGAGKALAGMTKRIDANITSANIYDLASLAQAEQLVAN